MTGASTKEKFWSGNEIRDAFLRFFEGKRHRRVRSSSLVPHGDATLLFTNAGMNQFKDVFLGLEKRDYTRATTAQKCVRAGGKHNDLENVGFTKRHHTFFEMLGNFSFGDYFKKEAIAYAWELITSPDWFAIPKDKLYVTIFKGEKNPSGEEDALPRDGEAHDLWLAHVTKDRIYEFGAEENFWAMGDTGPCGPCSEVHYDMGVEAVDDPRQSECTAGNCKFPCDCGRYVEIWNLVFMQYNRVAQGPINPQTGKYDVYLLDPLPKLSVDTGMGLERIAAVLQGVISNYHTDLFVPLLRAAARLTHSRLEEVAVGRGLTRIALPSESEYGVAVSQQVIADHARAATFLISDGVMPSNEGRGYVLRKIIRRAIQHGRLLGQSSPFFFSMVDAVCDTMRIAYPELINHKESVIRVVQAEETRFARTLAQAIKKLDDDLLQTAAEAFYKSHKLILAEELFAKEVDEAQQLLTDSSSKIGHRVRYVINLLKASIDFVPVFSAERAFRLYDTYGLPIDFVRDALRDVGIKLDEQGFEKLLQDQKARARASWKGGA